MASTYNTINYKCHQYAHGFVLIKLISEAREAKIDWLRAQLAVTEILLKVFSGKTESLFSNSDDHKVIQQQNLSYKISSLTNNCTALYFKIYQI